MHITSHAQIYAIKTGVLKHGSGPISSGREKGYDLNIELLWDSEILYASPAVGIELNNQGYTNFLYTGLSWEGSFFDFFVWELFFGGAIHDGELKPTDGSRRALGSRVLFREAIALGFEVTEVITVSFIYDHYSHSGMDESLYNQGNDNTGIRIGYYF
jgi:hypothetical protein